MYLYVIIIYIYVYVFHWLLYSTAADPVLSSVEREYRQEGMVERRTVEEERTEEEGEEERTRVAGGEDTFAESSSGLNRRWETSIMTAGGRLRGGMDRTNQFYLIYHYRLALIPRAIRKSSKVLCRG